MQNPPTEWRTIDEAAALLGVSTRTLQRRVAAGAIRSQRRDDGRTLVEVEQPRQATMDTAVVEQLQRQSEDANRIAALAAVASEQTALAFRQRLATVELALSDARADGRRWRVACAAAASVMVAAVVGTGFLWGQRAATERQLSDMARRLDSAEDARMSLADDLAAGTRARQASDAEAVHLRDQVAALQSLGFAVSDECPPVP